ncbi:hypothetical protein HanPI659440_Chr17g0699771 [Helianthus annuus]|nr:hypothetical protein HanPI659440_Chr17g0699771 [Helianthus annuus]
MVARSDSRSFNTQLQKVVKCGTPSASRSGGRSFGWLSVRTAVRSDGTPSWSFRSSYTWWFLMVLSFYRVI